MRPSIVLMAVSCWIMPCTIAAAQSRCVVISGTADALGKDNAVEKSVKSLREAIDKWKIENGVTGPVSETAEKRAKREKRRRTRIGGVQLAPICCFHPTS